MIIFKTLNRRFIVAFVIALCCGAGASETLVTDAKDALHRAVNFFRTEVSIQGGYLWKYSADLQHREGEEKASASQAWVQPPGTPSIGMAYLEVYHNTGDAYYLEAAVETARALVAGQLVSGGWEYHIEFDPEKRDGYAYRKGGGSKQRNISTLDDDTTQAALRCLALTDQALEFKDAEIHEAARYGLDCLVKAQYPNGAWPQRYREFPNPEDFPVMKASYPESWSREYVKESFGSFYTLNDNTLADVITLMFLTADIYKDDRYRASALRGGEFVLLAQMPDPQPAWAQQYDFNMHPAWARKFEPPAVTGGESQGVLRLLLELYKKTEDTRYLDSIERALNYFRASLRPDGKLARFYELETNTPLYFTLDYELTYSDASMPTHYSFVVGSALDAIEKEYLQLRNDSTAQKEEASAPKKAASADTETVTKIIAALDDRGAWVQQGKLEARGNDNSRREIIDVRRFAQNIKALSSFIAEQQHEAD